MNGLLAEILSAGGSLALMVVSVVWMYERIQKANAAKNGKDPVIQMVQMWDRIAACIEETHLWTRDLHRWHDADDDEGVKRWYVRDRGLSAAIERLASNEANQTAILDEIKQRLLPNDELIMRIEQATAQAVAKEFQGR